MPSSILHPDDAAGWDRLHVRFLTGRINYSESYMDGEASTKQAESLCSRFRRAGIGIHHHIAGPYLKAYASERAWCDDYRAVSNGVQYLAICERCPHAPRFAAAEGVLAAYARPLGHPHNPLK